MKQWHDGFLRKNLEEIIANDPLGLLDINRKASAVTADQRLIASFQEINEFTDETAKKEPTQTRDIKERRLFSRLKGLREDPVKAAALKEHDVCGCWRMLRCQSRLSQKR